MQQLLFSLTISFLAAASLAQVPQRSIDRKALVQRHNVIVTKADTLASLTVGNGSFAFTVDVTGLQTFPQFYQKGIPLGTQSEWGWHSFIDTVGYKREEALRPYHVNGRDITYMVQWNSPERNKAASNWFRQNPHRLQLGHLGFEIIKKDGTVASVEDIHDIHQQLDLWTGEIISKFTIESVPVEVSTLGHGNRDAIAVSVKSPLLKEKRLNVKLIFPYPTGLWTDEGTNYSRDKHISSVIETAANTASIEHRLDTTKYYVQFWWNNKTVIAQAQPHFFRISPGSTSDVFEFTATFTQNKNNHFPPAYQQTKISSANSWQLYWKSGGAIDFSGSTDKRAFELERRIILSQYLMRVQEAGYFPPQETGLTYNSWFGKPHLEMHWWHAVHYALWGRIELLEKSLDWYKQVYPIAKAIAGRQGFAGVRWQKMTDNTGEEIPSSVGALLIWQQPHFIYFAELCYRDKKDKNVLKKYKDLVFATADFMASFPYYDSAKQRYILGKGLIPAQERFRPEETFNPTYELVYWKWALSVAQQWNERLGMPRNKKWDEVIKKLSALPVQDNLYLAAESATDSYTNPAFRTDHPSVLAALGVMPATGQVNNGIMKNTFDWVWNNWTWRDTWGWDFPMTAMTAARLGLPDKAIDALLMNIQTNTYLPNGHNYQDDRLRIYMPGNGGLLTAIAMMVAGFDGANQQLPGIPQNGQWKVKWEGLKKMP
jgi:protein-glucosylgalactosylhydroxylysine glucosidase